MKFIKRFNEDITNEKSNNLSCLEAARDCVESHEVALDTYKDKNDELRVIELTESLMACELYIYSCEMKSGNLEKVADFVKSFIAKDIDEVKDSCLKLIDEIEKCDNIEE
jgi:hypothetical protein